MRNSDKKELIKNIVLHGLITDKYVSYKGKPHFQDIKEVVPVLLYSKKFQERLRGKDADSEVQKLCGPSSFTEVNNCPGYSESEYDLIAKTK